MTRVLDSEATTATERFWNVRLPDFLFTLFIIGDGQYMLGLGFNVSMFGVGLLTILMVQRALLQVEALSLRKQWFVPWLLVFLLAWVTVISILATPTAGAFDWTRRMIRMLAVLALAFGIATERLHVPSVMKGIATVLVVNLVAFYLRLTPDSYAGALTGWLGDKNRVGMYYAVAGILVLTLFQGWKRWAALAVAALAVWLTESRTSITALAFGFLWYWFVAARPVFVRWLAAGAGVWLTTFLEDNFARYGVFENRTGSDVLRARIDAAAAVKLAAAPPTGMGLGEAYVKIGGDVWLFHSSYATLLVEGGWVWAVGIVVVTVMVGLRPFRWAGETDEEARIVQGAAVATLICAWKLGEVFLTIPWGLLLGLGLNRLIRERTLSPPARDLAPR